MARASRRRLSLAAAMIAVAALPFAVDRIGGALAKVETRRALRAIPGLHVGSLGIDRATHRLLLRDLQVAAAQATVFVARAAVPLRDASWLGLVDRAAAANAAVTLDDVRITIGKSLIVVPHMEIEGSPLSATDLASLFDASHPGSFEDRLTKLSASALQAPEIIWSRSPENGAAKTLTVMFHDVALDRVAAGRIGMLTVGRIGADGGDDHGSATIHTGMMKASEIDIPLAMRIAKGARQDIAMPMQPIIGAFSLDTIAISASTTETTIESLRSEAIRGRPLLTSLADMAALTDKPAADRSEAEQHRIAETIADMVESFVIEHVEMKTATLRDTGSDPVSIGVGSFSIDGVEPGKVRLVEMEHVALSSKAAAVSLNRLALEGYDQTRLLDAVRQQGLSADPDVLKEHFGAVAPTFAHVALLDMHVDAPSDDLKGNAAHGTRTVVDIPRVEFQHAKTAEDTSTSTAHAQAIFDIAPDVVDPGLMKLLQAGFAHFDVSMDYAMTWSPKIQKATIDRISVAAEGLAAVSISGAFAHLDPALTNFSGDGEAALEAVQNVEVEALRVDIGNIGLAAKAWPLAAKAAGVSVPLLKAEVKGQLQVLLLKAMGDTPTAAKLDTALSRFIDDPKTMTLSVKAPAGLNLKAIADSGGGRALIDLLDIDAHANP